MDSDVAPPTLTELDGLRALLRRTNTVAFEYRVVIPGNEAYGDPGVLTVEIAGGSRFLFGDDGTLTMVLDPALMTEAEKKTADLSLADERELRTARLIASPTTRLLSARATERRTGTGGEAWLDPHLVVRAPAAAIGEFRSRREMEREHAQQPIEVEGGGGERP